MKTKDLVIVVGLFVCAACGETVTHHQDEPELKGLRPVSSTTIDANTLPLEPNQILAGGDDMLRERWRNELSNLALPTIGCFYGLYPNVSWIETRCDGHPSIPANPRPPEVVGGYNNGTTADGAKITSALGNFAYAKGFSTALDNNFGASSYSIQLNTNWFSTPACAGAADPSQCSGWQQFIFAQTAEPNFPSATYIQYWLLDYAAPCPGSDWNRLGDDCYTNSNSVPYHAGGSLNSILDTFHLWGKTASGGSDTAISYVGNNPNQMYAVGYDSKLSLASAAWTSVQFNIFGYADKSSVTFNAGASMLTRIYAYDSQNKFLNLACGNHLSMTAESSNLNYIGACCPGSNNYGDQGLFFTQGVGLTPANPVAVCPPTLASTW